jgi:hypothetical protein
MALAELVQLTLIVAGSAMSGMHIWKRALAAAPPCRALLASLLTLAVGTGCDDTGEPEELGFVEALVTIDGVPTAGVTVAFDEVRFGQIYTFETGVDGKTGLGMLGIAVLTVMPPPDVVCNPTEHRVDLAADSELAVTFQCFRNPDLRGRVTVGSEPASGVTMRYQAGTVSRLATADADGRYAFPNIIGADFSVEVEQPPGANCVPPIQHRQVTAKTTVVDFSCAGFIRPEIRGVIFVGSRNVGGVSLQLFNGTTLVATITSDASGAYQFTNVPVGSLTIIMTPPQGATCVQTQQMINIIQKVTTVNFNCTGEFDGTVLVCYDHTAPGVFSEVEKFLQTNPFQGLASYTLTVSGPIEGGASGVIAGQSPSSGTLDANGARRARTRVNRLGTYDMTMVVTSVFGVSRTFTSRVNVASGPSTCQM